jgi:hypothetical protein
LTLIFIGAGLQSPKKGEESIYRRPRYLNYGLLSLAASPDAQPGSVFHGNFDTPSQTLALVARRFPDACDMAFLVSCPSFLSLPWAMDFIEIASSRFPSSKFILGGRWVTNGNSALLRRRMPNLIAVVEGVGEQSVSDVIRDSFGLPYSRSEKAKRIFAHSGLSYVDYSKLWEPEAYVPSFEGSRGCGAGCNFCAEAAVPLSALKPVGELCAEIDAYLGTVTNPVRRFYLEASNFIPRIDWIDQFRHERAEWGQQDVQWRTEARVDIFSEKAIKSLASCGLTVLDLGLESASHTQLRAMGKSKNPETYIERATRLVRVAAQEGIRVKVNVLLYPGEDSRTLDSTVDWLESNRSSIAGVSVYPTVYYGFYPELDPVVSRYRALGAMLIPSHWPGVHNLDISPSMSHEVAIEKSREISRAFMSADQYYFLKSFSYFDPRYTRSDFQHDCESADWSKLPFAI